MSTVQGGQGNIVTNGLILNLDAANPRSYAPPFNGTTWQNIAPVSSSLTGSLVNGTFYTGSNGGALVFDGVDDFVTINDGIYSLSGGTLNAWARRTSGLGTFIGSYGGSGNQRSPSFFSITTNIGWEFGDLTVKDTGILFTANTWFNLGMTYDSGFNVRVYVNGNQVASGTSSNPGGFWNQFTIGRYGNFGSSFFNGLIPIVQVYNRALNASEVLQNFNATRARFGV